MAGSTLASAGRDLARHRAALAAAVALAALCLVALAAPWLSPHAAGAIDLARPALAPGADASHGWGTDRLGRDVFARTMQGLRISLLIGLAAALVSAVIGVAWGAVAGYAGGRIDAVMMRIVDILYALPFVFFVIILATLFGRGSVPVLLAAIASVGWLTTARIVRGQALALRRQGFIDAARAMGSSGGRILWRHILPNIAPVVILLFTARIGAVILAEASLSFLGLGIPPPAPTWGSMLSGTGRSYMYIAPWLAIAPGLCLTIVVYSINIFGDALRDLLDPRLRGTR